MARKDVSSVPATPLQAKAHLRSLMIDLNSFVSAHYIVMRHRLTRKTIDTSTDISLSETNGWAGESRDGRSEWTGREVPKVNPGGSAARIVYACPCRKSLVSVWVN